MKYAAALILIIGGLSIKSFAQGPPPPPPPPSIYKAPEKAELKEFTAEDKSFRITFPGAPILYGEVNTRAKEWLYKVDREGASSYVMVTEYNRKIDKDSGEFYTRIRNNLIYPPKTNLEAETDIEVDGVAGKEFVVNVDYVHKKVRVFVVGERVYQIVSDVTNWHILNDLYKEKMTEFNSETERFFSSFRFLKKQ